MEEIIRNLENFGFSHTEAKVYVTLLENGQLNGYQVSKILQISKSSAYSALNNLFKKNIIYLIPQETSMYFPEKPEIVFKRIIQKLEKSADLVITHLESEEKSVDLNYYNIYGYNNNLQKARELIASAKKEVLLNTELDIWIFENEIREAAANGARILLFVMHQFSPRDLPIEAYFFPNEQQGETFNKTLLVVDYKIALLFGGDSQSEIVGTFSENKNLIQLVSQHIGHDIYISKLIKKNGESPITSEERIYTIEENLFFARVDDSE